METHRHERHRSRQARAKITALDAKFVTRGGEINDRDDISSPEYLIKMVVWSFARVRERGATT
jgi:hypothetical protein